MALWIKIALIKISKLDELVTLAVAAVSAEFCHGQEQALAVRGGGGGDAEQGTPVVLKDFELGGLRDFVFQQN